MKKDIHPTYYEKATITCSCGAKHIAGATKEKMTVEICSKCHPFYTGKEKLIDTAGRVEKFKSRQKKAETAKTKTKPKKVTKKPATEAKKAPKSSKATSGQAAPKKTTTKKPSTDKKK